jgi:hypothetical protein
VAEYKLSTDEQLALRNIQFAIFKTQLRRQELEIEFRQKVEEVVATLGLDPQKVEFDPEVLSLRDKP